MSQDFSKLLDQVHMLVEDLKKEIKGYTKDDMEVPEWEEIQKREVLYKAYGGIVEKNTRINKLLSRTGSMIILIKDLKQSLLSDDSIPFTLKKSYRSKIELQLSKLMEYQKVLLCHKDSLDQNLRFYSSVQYILGSPRLMGME